MSFRLKLCGLHLASSLVALALVLNGLYLGWYRWPGWYLSKALRVAPILIAVDAALGPLQTLLVANPRKSRRELTRDTGMIVAVQLLALGYGTATLWRGRPLYYTFSENQLQLVQASDLGPREIELARAENPASAPYWYSCPRWVWAPLPADEVQRALIVLSATRGGDDVVQMPRYFQPWEQGLPALRAQLRSVDKQSDLWLFHKKPRLKPMLARLGFAPYAPVTMLMMGQSRCSPYSIPAAWRFGPICVRTSRSRSRGRQSNSAQPQNSVVALK